jgi:hypothetical protein
MIMSHHPNSGQNQNIWATNESFENVAKFKYLLTTLTDQNDIHYEIKSRLNLGNACYDSVQNLLSSHLKKNLQTKSSKIVFFATCTSWVQNFVPHFEVGTKTEGF